jgi:hypothetical protein
MMANKDDYRAYWVNFLSHGYQVLSEELLTPDIALIVSPDGSKTIVIGDDTSNSLYEYDEQERVAYIGFCNEGSGARFNCPGCEQSYIISLDGSAPVDRDTIAIHETATLFNCACGVVFALQDKYEFLSLPFRLTELAPLYLAGMSHTADLFVRYVLSSDGRKLTEEVGVVTQHAPEDTSLTEIPSFKFLNWCNPPQPSFVSDSFHAYEVQIWRTRTYKLASTTFEEKTYHPSLNGWQRVVRDATEIPDTYANERLLKALMIPFKRLLPQMETQPKRPRGGDTRTEEIRQLWANEEVLKRYAREVNDLLPVWKAIKSMAHNCDSEESQKEWATSMLEREIIKGFAVSHPRLDEDLLRRAVDTSVNRAYREPHLLAYFHAALEVEVDINGTTLSIMDVYSSKPPSPSTLKRLYEKGKALLD